MRSRILGSVTEPAATRRRGRPPRITRDQIVEVSVAIARERGVDAVTMTTVAAALDVAPPSLYHHVSGRDELLGLLGRRLVDPAPIDLTADLPWSDWLLAYAHAIRRQLLDDPALGVIPNLTAHGLLSVPALERGVEVLTEAGFSPDDAFSGVTHVVSTVFSLVYQEHCIAQERAAGRTRLAMFLDALHDVSREEAPRLWALVDAWDELPPGADGDLDAHFDHALAVLLAGLAAVREGRVRPAPARLSSLDTPAGPE